MKFKIYFIIFFSSLLTNAQTKIIGHKSHSGSAKSFHKSYKHNLFDINRSNFGLPGNSNIVILDSVIALNNYITILKIRESIVCFPYKTNYKDLKNSDFKFKSDTLRNDKLLNKKNSVKYIQTQKEYLFPYSNSIKSVVFIGFKKH